MYFSTIFFISSKFNESNLKQEFKDSDDTEEVEKDFTNKELNNVLREGKIFYNEEAEEKSREEAIMEKKSFENG